MNLYSLEYFRLLHDRLAEGGIVTYWLPLHSLEADDARAIVGAFCQAFADCTLWRSFQLHWMLVGTRDARGPGGVELFSRQWRDPRLASELVALGFEVPEQLGALFVADAPTLAREVGDVLPLVDDFPHRLAPMKSRQLPRWYADLGDATAARERFEASAWIARVWPEPLRETTLAYFEAQRHYDQFRSSAPMDNLEDLHAVLTSSSLRTLPLLMMGTDPDVERVALSREAQGDDTFFVHAQRCYRALGERRFLDAAEAARMALERDPNDSLLWVLRAYALSAAGRAEAARAVLSTVPGRLPEDVLAFLEGLIQEPPAGR